MRIVKRYSNRKLYDTHESRYVTLQQLEDIIKQGDSIKVSVNGSRNNTNDQEEDITVQTLAQILFEQQKRQPTLSVTDLLEVVRKGSRAFPNRV